VPKAQIKIHEFYQQEAENFDEEVKPLECRERILLKTKKSGCWEEHHSYKSTLISTLKIIKEKWNYLIKSLDYKSRI